MDYQLLSESERAVLRRLSVLAGGCTLDAAEVICSSHNIEANDILNLVARLVDKSLIVAQTQGQEARYYLAETVRQYSQLRLVEAEEAKRTRDVHLEYFLTIAEQAEPLLQRTSVSTSSDRLEAENDNIRAALQWSISGGDPNVGLKLAAALTYFWRTRGHVSEGIRWFENGLSSASVGVGIEKARAYFGLGWLIWWTGDSAIEIVSHCVDQRATISEWPPHYAA